MSRKDAKAQRGVDTGRLAVYRFYANMRHENLTIGHCNPRLPGTLPQRQKRAATVRESVTTQTRRLRLGLDKHAIRKPGAHAEGSTNERSHPIPILREDVFVTQRRKDAKEIRHRTARGVPRLCEHAAWRLDERWIAPIDRPLGTCLTQETVHSTTEARPGRRKTLASPEILRRRDVVSAVSGL